MMDSTDFSRRALLSAIGGVGIAGASASAFAQTSATRPALPPLEAFSRLPAVEHPVLSPDGRHVTFVSDSPQGRSLNTYDVETETGNYMQLGPEPVTHLMWADNAYVLVTTSSVRHEGPYDFMMNKTGLINLTTGDTKQFRRAPTQHPRSGINFKRITVDGSSRLTVPNYIVGHETTSRVRFSGGLSAMSLKSGRWFEMDVDGYAIIGWALRRDGTIVGRSEYNADSHVWTLRYKGDKGWKAIYSVKEPVDPPYLCGLGRDGNTLLIYFETGELAGRYVEMSPLGVMSEPFPLEGFGHYPLFSQSTYCLAGFATDRSIETYTFFDPKMQSLPGLISKALPDSRNYLIDYGEDPRHVLVLSENDEDSGTYIYINFLTGSFLEIGRPYPEVMPDVISQQTPFSYMASDGLEISGFVTRPRSLKAGQCRRS